MLSWVFGLMVLLCGGGLVVSCLLMSWLLLSR